MQKWLFPLCSIYFYPRSPCGERQARLKRLFGQTGDFYPRSPCGERPYIYRQRGDFMRNFYPRSPCGERRNRCTMGVECRYISTHALHAESDLFSDSMF